MRETGVADDARKSVAVGGRLESKPPVVGSFLLEDTKRRFSGPMSCSALFHAAVIVVALIIAARPVPSSPPAMLSDSVNREIVWLDASGPGGGGGGGGNKSPEPPRKAELPGKDKITVPVVQPLPVEETKKEEPPAEQLLNIPAQTLASSDLIIPGAIDSTLVSDSQGIGTGDGAGTGTGTGIGSGQGSGLGPGWGGGVGGGAYRPGNGVELPRVMKEVKPQYTADAMRAKVQGTVLLECVVQSDGTVGKVDVVRSLDRVFGLDQEAVTAARQWRFVPGTRFGQPVAVLVTIELTFTLR